MYNIARSGGAKWPLVGESSRRVNLNFSTKPDKSVDLLTNGRSPSRISLMIRKLSPPFSPVSVVSNNPRQPDSRQLCEPSVVGVRSINSTVISFFIPA
ncbi:hypothetical protein T11_8378 [Trichinella zimbabwensis]|uniref:Uncharacterized protein n=1 Tax=Trichinella zimbabwensis TaxID=268475 RepID=A0A0V1H1F3_9BILA|nr:hypothetical protein T11_8378 [Trichinella zimbabwensis]